MGAYIWPQYNHENVDQGTSLSVYQHGARNHPHTIRLDYIKASDEHEQVIEHFHVPEEMDITSQDFARLRSEVYCGSKHSEFDFGFGLISLSAEEKLREQAACFVDPMVRA